MNVNELLDHGRGWLATGEQNQIVISSRIRLARNLKDKVFPGWGGEEECVGIWESICSTLLHHVEVLQPALAVGMEELTDLDKIILVERHLMSREQAEKGRGSGLLIREDESMSVMVNEEDHLRLQVLKRGLDLEGAWRLIDQLDTEIESQMEFAFSPTLGYLTSCPTNVGTGMRASVMMHLPGLVLMNQINPIIKGLGKIGLTVRGLWGEGTESAGNMFQISNQMTLGDDEPSIVTNIDQVAREVVEHELNARGVLMEKKKIMVEDQVGRAYGILANAHLLSSKEALDLLSSLRLGIDLGIVKKVGRSEVDELLMLVQAGHLQKLEGRSLNPKGRDKCRAKRIRDALTSASRPRKRVKRS